MSILFPWYLARENAVETKDFKLFRNTELSEIVQRYSEQHEKFEQQQKKCVELLENLYKIEKSSELLGLKRKVYKGKKINTEQTQLKPDEMEKLNQYSQLLAMVMNLRNQYLSLYDAAENEGREKLQEIFGGSQKLLNPLPLLNRNFNYKLSKFLQEPTSQHKAKTKKIDFQLSRVLSRSTVKTSPFSSFTSVALRKWDDQPTERRMYSTRINFYIIQKIIDILTREPELRKFADYRMAPYLQGAQKHLFEVQIDLNRGKIFNNVDKKILLNSNALLNTLTEMFKQQEYISYDQLKAELMKQLNEEKCEQFLNALINGNILFPNTAVDEFVEYPEKDFLMKLENYAKTSKKAAKTLNCYYELEELLTEYERAAGLDRFEINGRITDKLTEIETILETVFQKDLVFYEDYIDDTIAVHPELKKIFKQEESGLSLMQKLSLLCNTSLEVRLEFAYAFKEKYGKQSISATNKEVYDLYMKIVNKFTNWTDVLAPVNGLKSPLAQKIETYKAAVKVLFLEAKQDTLEVQMDTEKIEALYRDYQENIHVKTDPSTILFQIEQDKMILNKIYSGKLRLFLRFFHYYDGIYEELDFVNYIDRVFPKTSVEITEGFGFNANHHQSFLKKRLILGNSRDVDNQSDQAVFLKDLSFKFDPNEDLVHLYDQEGEKLESIDVIGSLVDYMLPYSIQILNFNNSPRFDIDYINIWNEDKTKFIADYIPRLQIGDMTISRRKWILNINQLRSKKPANEQAFELVERFLKEGLPTEFFIKKYIGAENEGIDYATIKRTALKPKYVNIRSPLYIKDFIKTIDQNDYIMLEEVYPVIDGYKKNIEYQVEYGGIVNDV